MLARQPAESPEDRAILIEAQDQVGPLLEALFNLRGVCHVWLESPEVICASHTVPNEWWCHWHHHYSEYAGCEDSDDASNDYEHGPTPLAAVQAAYANQSRRCGDRTKGEI